MYKRQGLGVVADGVLGGHAQAAAFLVQVAGLLAKAVEAVVLFHPAVSHNAVVGVLDERVAGQGAVQLRAVSGQQLENDFTKKFRRQKGNGTEN